jgi:hypothetical protein
MPPHEKGEKLDSKLSRIVNSTFAFASAFVILMGGYYLVTALMAKLFGFDATAYYFGVKLYKNKLSWGRLNISFIYGVGTLFLLVTGLFSTYLFYKFKHKMYVLLLIPLWGMVIGGSMFAAQGIIIALGEGEYNSPFYQNLSVVASWLRLPLVICYLMGIPFLLAGIVFSLFYAKPFMTLAYSYSKVNNTKRKNKFFLETMLLPYLLGSIIVLIFTFPLNIWITLVYLVCIGLSLITSFFVLRFQSIKMDEVLRYKNLQIVNLPVVILFILLCLFGFLTWHGITIPF